MEGKIATDSAYTMLRLSFWNLNIQRFIFGGLLVDGYLDC